MTTSVRPGSGDLVEVPVHVEAAEVLVRGTRLFGLALFLVAEAMIFIPIFAVRFLISGTGQPAGLDAALVAALTVVMLASFAAMYGARRAAQHEKWPAASAALWIAAVLGLVTAVGSGVGWGDPALDISGGFGGTFYLATAAHAVHLVAGAAYVAGLAIRAKQGRLAGHGRTTLDCAYWFWAFLLVVWVAVGVVFYLV